MPMSKKQPAQIATDSSILVIIKVIASKAAQGSTVAAQHQR